MSRDFVLSRAHDLSSSSWSTGPIDRRLRVLGKAANLMRRHDDRIASVIAECGCTALVAAQDEVRLSADIFEYYASEAAALLAPTYLTTPFGLSRLELRPVGVMLAISLPAPFYRLVRMAACNLAAGNAVIASRQRRPDSRARVLAGLFAAAGAPEGAWTDLVGQADDIDMLARDDRVHGIALANRNPARRSCLGGGEPWPGKPIIQLEPTDLFAVSEDDGAARDGGEIRATSFLARFTSALIHQPEPQ